MDFLFGFRNSKHKEGSYVEQQLLNLKRSSEGFFSDLSELEDKFEVLEGTQGALSDLLGGRIRDIGSILETLMKEVDTLTARVDALERRISGQATDGVGGKIEDAEDAEDAENVESAESTEDAEDAEDDEEADTAVEAESQSASASQPLDANTALSQAEDLAEKIPENFRELILRQAAEFTETADGYVAQLVVNLFKLGARSGYPTKDLLALLSFFQVLRRNPRTWKDLRLRLRGKGNNQHA